MEQTAAMQLVEVTPPSFQEAWEMVLGQLRMEMGSSPYNAYVRQLEPLGFKEGVYRVGAVNAYTRDWVESRLRSRVKGLLEGIYQRPLTLNFALIHGTRGDEPPSGRPTAPARGGEGQELASENHAAAESSAAPSGRPTGGAASSANPAAPQPGERAPGSPDHAEGQPARAGSPSAANRASSANRGEAADGSPTGPAPSARGEGSRPQTAQQAPLPALAGAAPTLTGQLPLSAPPMVDLPSARPASRKKDKEPAPQEEGKADSGRSRKFQLQRAYGTERARVIQPERGMFLTMYFFNQWLPLLGHSAMTTIIAARSLCYWNPMTGELRNTVETDMSELARRASVSVRTVKDVLNNELVKQYFLRYKVRRIMTTNGVRTAGILLQVRMDDPLTPEDQDQHHLTEEEHWYTLDFEEEE